MIFLKKYSFYFLISLLYHPFFFCQTDVFEENCDSFTEDFYNNSISNFETYCLELPSGNGSQVYEGDYGKAVKVSKYIELKDNLTIKPPSKGGSNDFFVEKAIFQVVSFAENMDAIPKLSNLELGLDLPTEVNEAVRNFIEDQGNPKLNPYLSSQIKIEAIFEWDNPFPFGPSVISIKRDGFYFIEYDRDISKFNDLYNHPLANNPDVVTGEEYSELGGGWTKIATDYPFRIRFAPPRTGLWRCKVKIILPQENLEFSSSEFTFNVIDSNKKGYLKTDDNNRFLKRDGESFRPIGLNYPWPIREGFPLRGLSGDSKENKLVNGGAWYNSLAPIAAYEQYLRMMDTLAMNGVNYFRMIMNPWSLDIEYEKLGDYTDRMHIAKELDLIVERAQQNDMLIHWNFMLHNTLQTNGYNINFWDWSEEPHPDYPDTPTGGYCYKTQLDDVETPLDFLTSEKAKKYYKERLRYIVARWGYSPDIGMFEHFSEINQIGTRYEYTLEADEVEYTNQYPGNEIKFAQWHDEMSKYLKHELEIPQLLTLSYTTALKDPFAGGQDYSFSIPEIDVINWNNYNFGGNDPFFDLDRWHKKGFNRPIEDLKNGEIGSSNTSTGRGEYLKPMFYSEHGASKIWGCDVNEVETVRSIWKSFFTGVAGALEWEGEKTKTLQTYQNVRDFIEGVDLEGEEWHSGITELQNDGEWLYSSSFASDCIRDDESADLVYLRSGDKKKAFGVITNRTYNYHTKGGCTDAEFQPAEPFLQSFGSSSPSSNNNRLRLRNMELGGYTIKYYKYNNPSFLLKEEGGYGSQVTLNYPPLTADNWIVLFTAHRSNINFKSQEPNSYESFNGNSPRLMRKNELKLYPIPTDKTLNYSFENLDDCRDAQIKIYNSIGEFILNYSKNRCSGEIDVSKLKKGFYTISFKTETGVFRRQFIIN